MNEYTERLKNITKQLRVCHAHFSAAGLLGEASSYPVVKLIVEKLKSPVIIMGEMLDLINKIIDEGEK